MEEAESAEPEVDEQEEGQAIGERLLEEVGEELGAGGGIDGGPLVGKQFVALEVLIDPNTKALEVYLKVLEGMQALPGGCLLRCWSWI